MTNLLIGLVAALAATNQPLAVSNLVTQTTGITITVPNADDPIEKEYHKLMEDDDVAQAEVDGWIRENNSFAEKGGGMPPAILNGKIDTRLAIVKKSYLDFLAQHPDHARARVAYGSFLNDTRDEEGALAQFEKARELDPKLASAWNQAANYYGHRGPVTNAFAYYAKCIELEPGQSLYYENLATVVYLYRTDSKEYYHLTEQQVFDKALGLYEKARSLDPNNFELAQDIAQTYYGIRPWRVEDALKAWTNALSVATTDIERQGVYVHFARLKLNQGDYAEARRQLSQVSDVTYTDLKARILRNITQAETKGTNQTPIFSTNAAAISNTNTTFVPPEKN